MDWQDVFNSSRSDAEAHRQRAVLARASAADCALEAKAAPDTDSGVLWLLRAMQQRSAAVSSDAASEISDRIADLAERVLHPAP